MGCPCETRTSTCRSFATISSGLYRFLAITVLLDVKDIPQVGPLQWGRISVFDILGQQLPEFLDQRGLSFVVPTCWAIISARIVASDLTKGLVQGQIRIDCEFDSVGGEQHVVVSGPLREVTVSFEPCEPFAMGQFGLSVV